MRFYSRKEIAEITDVPLTDVKHFKRETVSKEELETMSFDDIAYVILKEKGKKMKISDIFKIICDALNLGDAAFEAQIGDFFALISTEKRFIQLEKGYIDLRENHTSEININDIEEESEDDMPVEDVQEDDEDESEETDYYDDIDDMDDDRPDDDYKDLVIVDEGYEDEVDL